MIALRVPSVKGEKKLPNGKAVGIGISVEKLGADNNQDGNSKQG
jgi:hypothetical protein